MAATTEPVEEHIRVSAREDQQKPSMNAAKKKKKTFVSKL
jgi:hypothetical protein